AGEIPALLGQLRNLQVLRLHSNRLTGEYLWRIWVRRGEGFFSRLDSTDESRVRVGGIDVLESGGLFVLSRSVTRSVRPLAGPIPSELGHLSALKELYLTNNELSGESTRDL
ncbi:unnamed protein product, partial [Ectocarpus sp. 8 AP-2014]